MDRPVVPVSRASVGSDADGHITVGYLWVEHRSAGVGSIGIVYYGWMNSKAMAEGRECHSFLCYEVVKAAACMA